MSLYTCGYFLHGLVISLQYKPKTIFVSWERCLHFLFLLLVIVKHFKWSMVGSNKKTRDWGGGGRSPQNTDTTDCWLCRLNTFFSFFFGGILILWNTNVNKQDSILLLLLCPQLSVGYSLQSLCFGLTSWEMIFTDILFLESVDS